MKYKIYMGWDPREESAYEVSKFSILERAALNSVSILPVELIAVKHILKRPIEKRGNQLWDPISDAPMSTEFAVSRFCVPFLCHSGWALFIDSDILCLTDIAELFALADDKYAVMCVKHNHVPTEKFHDGGMIQTVYKRKNWSSVMLFNCSHPGNKNLTLEALNTWPGRDLHAFKWLKDEEIGELPAEWNFLVGVNEGKLLDQKLLHYTNGTPAWGESYEAQPTDWVWNREYDRMKQYELISYT